MPGPVTRVPSLEELERLTEIPDRRVVFRGVDWAFYEELVDSIPEGSNIHVDYDGKDLEVMGKGWDHEDIADSLGHFVNVVAEEIGIPCKGCARRHGSGHRSREGWRRPVLLLPAREDRRLRPGARVRRTSLSFPTQTWPSRWTSRGPQVDRAGIYAALGVAEVWRFDDNRIIIERLTPAGTYIAAEASGFLPVRAEEIQRWIVDEDRTDDTAWTAATASRNQNKSRQEIRRVASAIDRDT